MLIKDDIVRKIEELASELGNRKFFRKPIVGFSSAGDNGYNDLKSLVGSHHVHPRDILSNARTVISFFIPFTKEVVNSNRKSSQVSEEWAKSYIEANELINSISQKMVDYFVDLGIDAETIRATHTYNPETLTSAWSHRSAAFIAGLGTFGLNRMLITPLGCAGRYGSIIISEELPITSKEEGDLCGYFRNKSCMFCIKNCPSEALTLDGFNRFICNDHLLKVSKEFTNIGICDVCGKCVIGPCSYIED